MLNINEITEKPHTVTEHQYGDTIFTVVSVESQRARETLHDSRISPNYADILLNILIP